jgi:hypothetical protein
MLAKAATNNAINRVEISSVPQKLAPDKESWDNQVKPGGHTLT